VLASGSSPSKSATKGPGGGSATSIPTHFTLNPTGACTAPIGAVKSFIKQHPASKGALTAAESKTYQTLFITVERSCPASQINAIVNLVVEPWLLAQTKKRSPSTTGTGRGASGELPRARKASLADEPTGSGQGLRVGSGECLTLQYWKYSRV